MRAVSMHSYLTKWLQFDIWPSTTHPPTISHGTTTKSKWRLFTFYGHIWVRPQHQGRVGRQPVSERKREKERDVLSYIGVVWNSELEKISGQSRRTRHTFIDLTIWVWYTLDCGFLWISSHFGWWIGDCWKRGFSVSSSNGASLLEHTQSYQAGRHHEAVTKPRMFLSLWCLK